jgi:hypothetical protein
MGEKIKLTIPFCLHQHILPMSDTHFLSTSQVHPFHVAFPASISTSQVAKSYSLVGIPTQATPLPSPYKRSSHTPSRTSKTPYSPKYFNRVIVRVFAASNLAVKPPLIASHSPPDLQTFLSSIRPPEW